MCSLPESPLSIALIESFYNAGKPIALVCHAPGVLRHVTYQDEPLVKGKQVTGFTNSEEEEVQLTHIVPFLVKDELQHFGAIFEKVDNWQPFSIVDGRLIYQVKFRVINLCSSSVVEVAANNSIHGLRIAFKKERHLYMN